MGDSDREKKDAELAALVAAVRADPLVGRATCSVVAECYDDADIMDELDARGIETAEAAVKWARDTQQSHLSRALDCRCGEDDDPELVEWRRWKAARKAAEGGTHDEA